MFIDYNDGENVEFIKDEDIQFLQEEKITRPLRISSYYWFTILGIAKQKGISGDKLMIGILEHFLDRYWQNKNKLDLELDGVHQKHYDKRDLNKEFLFDYAKWLIDNDEEIQLYGQKAWARNYYMKNKERILAVKQKYRERHRAENMEWQREYRKMKKKEKNDKRTATENDRKLEMGDKGNGEVKQGLEDTAPFGHG